MCMVMRGVQKLNSKTLTSVKLGIFIEKSEMMEEFINLLKLS
jgi:GTP cyclohydrolase I